MARKSGNGTKFGGKIFWGLKSFGNKKYLMAKQIVVAKEFVGQEKKSFRVRRNEQALTKNMMQTLRRI